MTTEDRAYEAAARSMFAGFDNLPDEMKPALVEHARKVVDAFLTAMGQEVR